MHLHPLKNHCSDFEMNQLDRRSNADGERVHFQAKRKPSEKLYFQGFVVVATGLEPVTPSM